MRKFLTLGGVLLAALAGCETTPKSNVVMDNARAAVRSAEADPNVSQYAQVELKDAQGQLQQAEGAFAKHDKDEMDQRAYLATQDAKVAQLRGGAKADDARVANGQSERDRIQLAARQREIDAAKSAVDAAKSATADAVADRDRMRAELEQLKATQTTRGLVMTLGDVLFDTGKSDLKSGGERKLDQLVEFLKAHPNRRVQIDGFTDSVGSDSYNQSLSEARAQSVKNALVGRGIDSSRIGVQGYGKSFPVAGNGDSAGRQLNRRVEVVIGVTDNAEISPRTASIE